MTYYAWRVEVSVNTPTSNGRSYYRNEYLLAVAEDFTEAVALVEERYIGTSIRIHKVMKERPFGDDILLPHKFRARDE